MKEPYECDDQYSGDESNRKRDRIDDMEDEHDQHLSVSDGTERKLVIDVSFSFLSSVCRYWVR